MIPRVAHLWLFIGGGVCLLPASAETLDPNELSPSERPVATDEVDEDWVVEDSGAEEHNPSHTAAALTTIHIDESIPQSADLTQLIDSASGTTIVQLGGLGDFAGLSIRGSSLQQVEVFLDGIPLNPDGASTVNLAELPLWAFQRIEIYRSLPPLWMGSAAMGGAVNLVSKESPSQGQISGTLASHQTGRMHAATGYQAPEKPLDILFFADAFSTESNFEYFDDNGTIYNTSDDQQAWRNNNDKLQLSGHGRLRWGTDALRLTILESYLSRDEGVPGHIQIASEHVRLATQRNLLSTQISAQNGAFQIQVTPWWLNRQESLEDQLAEVSLAPEWTRHHFDHLGFNSSISWAALSWIQGMATVQLRQDRYLREDLLSENITDPRRRRVIQGSVGTEVYLFEERVSLSPAVRGILIDNRAIDGTPFDETPLVSSDTSHQQALTPRAGLRVDVRDNWVLKSTFAQTLRPPDLAELFGDRGGIVGNAALVPEEASQVDAGVRWTPEGASWRGSADLSAFYKQAQNLIVYEQNSQRTMTPRNVGQSRVYGAELSLQATWKEWLDVQFNMARVESENREEDPAVNGMQLPRIPAISTFQSLTVHLREHLSIGQQWSFTDGNYWDATNWYRSAPRSIHGAFIQATPNTNWPRFELAVRNWTNRSIENVPRNPLDLSDPNRIDQAITDFVGYPLPGRTWLLSIQWQPQSQDPA